MDEVIIRAANIEKKFGSNNVLSGIDCDIYKGDIYGLIGMSGSGKTTLLNILIGFLDPDSGNVKIKSDQLLSLKESYTEAFIPITEIHNHVKQTFGFAAQKPSFYSKLTAKQNLEYFGKMYGLPKEIINTNGEVLLRLMRIYDSRHVVAGNLSMGMQKRLDIACALIHDPKVLILDEPTADLDPFLRREMWDLLKKINNKGTTIIVASHFLDEIDSLCSHVGILLNGRIVKSGTPDEVRSFYIGEEQIHIETTPGRYGNLINQLNSLAKKLEITKMVNKGHKLVIFTLRAEMVIHTLLHILEKEKETLFDIYISKPDLETVFTASIKESLRK